MTDVRFSRRTAWTRLDLAPRDASTPLLDLTESNPTRCALFASEPLVAALGHPRGARYEPDSIGERSARDAIAADYATRGIALDSSRIVLSASTSEAYGWLFKLLCDRGGDGDEVLIARPSYPLFDLLADLEDVKLVRFPLMRESRWRPDVNALDQAITRSTRAIVLVHPNNPTGTFLRRDDARAIDEMAAKYGLALIVDEVFGDYGRGVDEARLPSFAHASHTSCALTFVMSGLSKVMALPQLKLAWTIVRGPDALVKEALARLELVADAYLSVATPVQRALAEILPARAVVQAQVMARLGENLAALDAALERFAAHVGARRLAFDGGWCALVELPRTMSDVAWVEWLRTRAGVLVQPGSFFDFEREATIVVSLLPPVADFRRAAEAFAIAISDGVANT
ncbi:MAG: pyridoxal phosphate-dependent aminotransferase [Polyangiales bacterium]